MTNPRYKGLRPNPGSLGVTLLEEGEETRTMRVRAAADVMTWAAALSAAERGEILARAYLAHLHPAPPQALKQPADHIAPPTGAAPKLVASDPLAGVIALSVQGQQVPQGLKNRLRWAPDRYSRLEAVLAGEAALHLDLSSGKPAWRSSRGEHIRRDTVLHLLEAGVLAALP